ncbi:hypothetical protein AMK17_33575 [Streptomyces sp. CB00072]|nr:hypothetical protein AMK17_33575 [Streptomyces sp. CB00072]
MGGQGKIFIEGFESPDGSHDDCAVEGRVLLAGLPPTGFPLCAAARGRLLEPLLYDVMYVLSVAQVIDHAVQWALEGVKCHAILSLGLEVYDDRCSGCNVG